MAEVSPAQRTHIQILNAGLPLAAFNGDPTIILERLRGGESVKQVALSLGIAHQAVYEWLLSHCPDEWRMISASKSLQRLEDAEGLIDQADDQVKVSKARESHRMGQWSLEKVARGMYGDSKNGEGITINVVVDRSCGGTVTIENEP